MPEESHLEEMRAAIRGDFARLAERRGDQKPVLAPTVDDDDAAVPVIDTAVPAAGRRSWLARLLGR